MPDDPDPPHPRPRWRSPVGGVGLACGLLALAAALIPSWIAPLYEPPATPLHERAAEWIGQLRDYATGKTDAEVGSPSVPAVSNPWRSPRLAVAALLLAFAALAWSAVVFVVRGAVRCVCFHGVMG